MKFLQQSWPVWGGVLLYAGAMLKFGLATADEVPPVPQWVWWSINAAFIATFLVALQTLMIVRRLDESKRENPPPNDSEDVL